MRRLAAFLGLVLLLSACPTLRADAEPCYALIRNDSGVFLNLTTPVQRELAPGEQAQIFVTDRDSICLVFCTLEGCQTTCASICPFGSYAIQMISTGLTIKVLDAGSCEHCIEGPRRLDVNNLNMVVTNLGSIASDLETGSAGLEYPRGSGNTAMYGAGLWVGCHVNGETRVTVAEYSQEFLPGVMTGPTGFDDPVNPAYHCFKIYALTGNPADTMHLFHNGAELAGDPRLDGLIHHSWAEYMQQAAPHGAPVRTYLDPAAPGGVRLGPDVSGDQMIWSVFNDANPARHFAGGGGTAPLGIEVRQTAFAFNRRGELGNRVYVRYQILNRGPNTLLDAYVALWMDPDLGLFTDDMIGSDPGQLGYCYNATNNDPVYGPAPPAVGIRWLEGPKVGAGRLKLSALAAYTNGTDPEAATGSYNSMRGLNTDGSPMVDPLTGFPTTFEYDGDPVTGAGWLDPHPADKRMLASCGPFTMAPGDTQTVLAMILIGQGTDRLSSITAMRDLATPALISLVSAVADRDGVRLRWRVDAGATARIDRSEGAGGPWELAANVTADAGGDLAFDDRAVVPGIRYGYRVGLAGPNGTELLSPEVWLDVPQSVELALQGVRPNPSTGVPTIAFTLPTVAKGEIEVFDLSGRRVASRTLDGVAAGQHLMRLDDTGPLPPGVYLVRLTHGPRVLTVRAVMLR